MKMCTTPEQTAKLIELGFEKPKGWYVDGVTNNINLYVNIDENPMMFNYSVGELIEILPSRYNGEDLEINRDWKFERWLVFYRGDDATAATELVDALYDMCIKLKEEGAIWRKSR